MERRRFLKTALLGSIAGAVSINGGQVIAADRFDNGTPGAEDGVPNDLVAVMGGDPEQLYSSAIKAMGGMGRFVKKGQKVTIKPNIGWDKTPEYAADTNPELVALIVKDCIAAGASEVTVFDHTCDEWSGCYRNSGIQAAVQAAGGKMAFAHEQKYYREVELPEAKKLHKAKIHEAILDCDVWINVPILKNHGGARMTISMKNYMGIVWDRRAIHANDLQQCIADCTTFGKKPVLNIVDAYRIMTQNGPKGKSLDDVQLAKAIFMSTDIVAVDTASVKFYNQYSQVNLDRVSHIKLAEQANVGTTNLDSLKIERIKL